MSLQDQVAIVTGASRGIGRAIALSLAKQGAHIVVAARTEPLPGTIEETALMVQQLGRKAVPVEMNVTAEADVKRTIDAAIRTFGRIDILVNNAGTNWGQTVADFEPRRWQLGLMVNAFGPFLCCKYALPHLLKERRGHVLNISSIRAVQYAPASSAYSASKAALEALTGSLATEVYEQGICVNALRVEGTVETPGTTMLLKLKRTMWPAEVIGEAAAYVVRQPFPYTGNIRTISDLRSHVPRIDELLANVGQ